MTIEATVGVGDDLEKACRDATEIAERLGCYVRFTFNGERMLAGGRLGAADIAQDYRRRTTRSCMRCGAEAVTRDAIDPRTGWCRGAACLRG